MAVELPDSMTFDDMALDTQRATEWAKQLFAGTMGTDERDTLVGIVRFIHVDDLPVNFVLDVTDEVSRITVDALFHAHDNDQSETSIKSRHPSAWSRLVDLRKLIDEAEA